MHLLNYVFPNIFEVSPHIIQASFLPASWQASFQPAAGVDGMRAGGRCGMPAVPAVLLRASVGRQSRALSVCTCSFGVPQHALSATCSL